MKKEIVYYGKAEMFGEDLQLAIMLFQPMCLSAKLAAL